MLVLIPVWYPVRDPIHSGVGLAGGLALLSLVPVLACGPNLAPTVLDRADDVLRTMPEADFRAEIDAMCPRPGAGPGRLYGRGSPAERSPDDPIHDAWMDTVRTDVDELGEALREAGLPERETRIRVAAYRVFRVALGGYGPLVKPWSLTDEDPWPDRPQQPPAVPGGLPQEFALYARGAAAFRMGRVDEARVWWLAVLDLPPASRRYKSTWAAFMLGRTQPDEEGEAAMAWFRLVRSLEHAGYADALGLASESLGWEAQRELFAGRFEEAAELYLAQRDAGDEGALVSLQRVARCVLAAGPERMRRAARHPLLRQVVTAFLVSRGDPWNETPSPAESQAWLAALERAGIRPVDAADRLAWLAYEHGDFDAATRWMALAPPESVTARWLKAKLALRDGDTAAAGQWLEGVVRRLDTVVAVGDPAGWPSFTATEQAAGRWPGSQPAGELAALQMTRGRYADALDLLLRHGWWTDAAYVGERVLTTAELRDYVDRWWPLAPPEPSGDAYGWGWWDRPADADETGRGIRYLLSRRLAREGDWRRAMAYCPAPLQAWLRDYGESMEAASQQRRPTAEQAARLWRAARIMRRLGMELFGTEVDPDWHVYEGEFELQPWGEARAVTNGLALAPVPADEAQRAARHAVVPNERFHYRYVAADLGWQAAALMPDDSPVTALVLCQSGMWLRSRDPKAADRFYKALVRRCGKTDLGRAAERLRWFPPCPAAILPEEPGRGNR